MSDSLSVIYDQPDITSAADRETIEHGIEIVSWRLSQYTGLSVVETFNAVFGEQHFRYNNGGEFYESSTGDALIFRRGRVYLQLVIHALGHTFDRRAGLRPQIQLAAGRFNLRHGLLFAGMHPPSMEGGNDPNERWANTWENWIIQTFAPNIFGVALDKFMAEKMAEWVAEAMGKVAA